MKALNVVVFLIIVTVVTSCAPDIEIEPSPELDRLVDSFYEDAAENGRILVRQPLVIGFANLRADLGGDSNRKGTVRINSAFRGRHELQWVVYHELGHAILQRGHTAGNTSIMAPTMWNNGNISRSLLVELFTE